MRSGSGGALRRGELTSLMPVLEGAVLRGVAFLFAVIAPSTPTNASRRCCCCVGGVALELDTTKVSLKFFSRVRTFARCKVPVFWVFASGCWWLHHWSSSVRYLWSSSGVRHHHWQCIRHGRHWFMVKERSLAAPRPPELT